MDDEIRELSLFISFYFRPLFLLSFSFHVLLLRTTFASPVVVAYVYDTYKNTFASRLYLEI